MADFDVVRPVRALPVDAAGVRIEWDRPQGTDEAAARPVVAVQEQVAAPFLALSGRPETDTPRDSRGDGGASGRNTRPGPPSAFIAQQIAQDHGGPRPPAEVVAEERAIARIRLTATDAFRAHSAGVDVYRRTIEAQRTFEQSRVNVVFTPDGGFRFRDNRTDVVV